jgi:hypothetical protein
MALLTSVAVALLCQTDQSINVLTIDGHPGRAEVIHKDGRTYVDLRAFTEMVGASVTFRPGLIVLTLPPANTHGHAPEFTATSEPEVPDEHALSRDFSRAGIEAVATMREWASTLAYAIENNYHVTDDWIAKYREQAQYDLRLASAASSTDADRKGLQLLTNEFDAVRVWSDKLVQARKSMDTAKYAMAAGTLRNEELFQKIIACGHFLASMFGGNSYKDDSSCH